MFLVQFVHFLFLPVPYDPLPQVFHDHLLAGDVLHWFPARGAQRVDLLLGLHVSVEVVIREAAFDVRKEPLTS